MMKCFGIRQERPGTAKNQLQDSHSSQLEQPPPTRSSLSQDRSQSLTPASIEAAQQAAVILSAVDLDPRCARSLIIDASAGVCRKPTLESCRRKSPDACFPCLKVVHVSAAAAARLFADPQGGAEEAYARLLAEAATPHLVAQLGFAALTLRLGVECPQSAAIPLEGALRGSSMQIRPCTWLVIDAKGEATAPALVLLHCDSPAPKRELHLRTGAAASSTDSSARHPRTPMATPPPSANETASAFGTTPPTSGGSTMGASENGRKITTMKKMLLDKMPVLTTLCGLEGKVLYQVRREGRARYASTAG